MIYAATLIILALIAKRKNPQPMDNSSDFAKALYRWISIKAGGLANGNLGGDSSLPRVDCDIRGSNGALMVPRPHTSADVTWKTYKFLAPKLGINPTCEDWAAMSNIEKSPSWYKFVDYYRRKGLRYSSNPVLAAYMGLWYWGGWDQTLMPTNHVLAVTQSALSNKIKLRRLVELRKQYFELLGDKRGYSNSLVESWKNRAEEFYQNFNQFV